MSTYWRAAGLSYLQYLSVASEHLRTALRRDAKKIASQRSVVHFRSRQYDKGTLKSTSERPLTILPLLHNSHSHLCLTAYVDALETEPTMKVAKAE
jgi:hypothetical protein